MEILKIKPIFKEMLWGGSQLKELYGYDIPTNLTGEAWVVSSHKDGDCIIQNGIFKDKSLSFIYREYRSSFGKGSNKIFPLLVKIINARENLSIQVHPNDEYAEKFENSKGKTEAWLVLNFEKNTNIIIGHNFKSKNDFKKSLTDKTLLDNLMSIPLKEDDFFFIPAGTVHAICAGTIIYEVQQNSNLTYRIYDYERVDSRGLKRDLHIDKALDVIKIPYEKHINDFTIVNYPNMSVTKLISSEYFNIEKVHIKGNCEYIIETEFIIIGCIQGKVKINNLELLKGEHCIVPHCFRNVSFEGEAILIISSPNEILL